MEVERQKENNRGSDSSSSKAHISCQPCFGEGEHIEAEGFCQNCKEYLCATCITYHRKLTLSKHHVILDKQNMPSTKQQSTTPLTCVEICETHGTELVKFFCTQHEVVGCGDCMIFGHKPCNVDYISDIAEDFVNGNEFSALVKEVERLKSVVKEVKEEMENGEKDTYTAYIEAVSSIKQFRKEFDAYLDRMERELLLQCDELKEENKSCVQNITDECHNAEKQLQEIEAQLTSKDQATSVFIKAKSATSRITEIDKKLLHVCDKLTLQVIEFKRSQDIDDLISDSYPLGKLETSERVSQLHSKDRINLSNLTPVKNKYIDIKMSSDKTITFISSIAKVDEETLACTDWNNHKVKLVDISRCVIKGEISLHGPWDLTCIPDNQIAVTLVSNKQIQFLSTRGGLSKLHSISVNGQCRGIAYSDDRLYVTYEKDPKVEIMTLGGDVLQCFQYDQSGKALLKWPLYVALSNDASCMYISDSTAKSVMRLSFKGQVLATYKDNDLMYPRKLAVCKDGSVVVCDSACNNLHLISSECTKIETRKDVGRCWAICIDDQANTLYLGLDGGDKIRAYTMK